MKPSDMIRKLGYSSYTKARLEKGVPETELLVKGLMLYLDILVPKIVKALEKVHKSLTLIIECVESR